MDFSGTGKPQEPPVPHLVGRRSSVCPSHKGPPSGMLALAPCGAGWGEGGRWEQENP